MNALFANNPQLSRESIDALIVVTQNGDEEGLPHTAAIVQDKLGLPTHVAAFDISLGCSGYVYGIYALKGFMEAAGLKNGLLVTADPYSKIVDPEDRNTTMLFGDAATATWMAEDASWQLGKAKFGTDGSGAPHLKVSDGVFFMNGRQVFNFALLKVPAHLHELLAESSLQPSDIDAFCIHQGSAAIVDAVARRFEGEPEKFIKDMVETGNTVSSSIPLLLESTSWMLTGSAWQSVVLVWACRGARRFCIAIDPFTFFSIALQAGLWRYFFARTSLLRFLDAIFRAFTRR